MQIKRNNYVNQLIASMHNGMIKVITGLRRSGKSYLLFTLFREYLLTEGVSENHIIAINLEDRRHKNLRNPDVLLEYIDGKMNDNSMYYILLDEIQLVPEFEDVLNSYLSVSNADVYVTGSNSRFLSSDVITEFRGRGDEIFVMPLSFSEFYSVFNGSKEDALAQYLTYGGLPKVVELDERKKMEYLKGLFKKTYLTDIEERYHIKNISEMNELIDILASTIGGLVNPKKISDTFMTVKRKSITQPTIKYYLDILQEVFLLKKSIRYDIKGRKYIDTPAKYYFQDLGLRNARINFRQIEETHLMENLIYNELCLRGFSVDVGVVTRSEKNVDGVLQRNLLEVDFVCNCGSKRLYIQSAYHLPTLEKRQQEIRSLNSIHDNFQKVVITDDHIVKHQDDNGIVWINILDFLSDEHCLDF